MLLNKFTKGRQKVYNHIRVRGWFISRIIRADKRKQCDVHSREETLESVQI